MMYSTKIKHCGKSGKTMRGSGQGRTQLVVEESTLCKLEARNGVAQQDAAAQIRDVPCWILTGQTARDAADSIACTPTRAFAAMQSKHEHYLADLTQYLCSEPRSLYDMDAAPHRESREPPMYLRGQRQSTGTYLRNSVPARSRHCKLASCRHRVLGATRRYGTLPLFCLQAASHSLTHSASSHQHLLGMRATADVDCSWWPLLAVAAEPTRCRQQAGCQLSLSNLWLLGSVGCQPQDQFSEPTRYNNKAKALDPGLHRVHHPTQPGLAGRA